MRAYLIDEVPQPDMKRIEEFLARSVVQSDMCKIFWVPFPPHLLEPTQAQHIDCQPHVFATELGDGWVKMELYVRTLKRLGCECQAYCSKTQEHFVIGWANQIMETLRIRT